MRTELTRGEQVKAVHIIRELKDAIPTKNMKLKEVFALENAECFLTKLEDDENSTPTGKATQC